MGLRFWNFVQNTKACSNCTTTALFYKSKMYEIFQVVAKSGRTTLLKTGIRATSVCSVVTLATTSLTRSWLGRLAAIPPSKRPRWSETKRPTRPKGSASSASKSLATSPKPWEKWTASMWAADLSKCESQTGKTGTLTWSDKSKSPNKRWGTSGRVYVNQERVNLLTFREGFLSRLTC